MVDRAAGSFVRKKVGELFWGVLATLLDVVVECPAPVAPQRPRRLLGPEHELGHVVRERRRGVGRL